jgi:hypothetical protein
MLQELLASITRMTRDIGNIAGVIEKNVKSAHAITDVIQRRRQLDRWESLLEKTSGISRGHIDALRTMKNTAEQLKLYPAANTRASSEARQMLANIAREAVDIKEYLEQYHGDLIFEKHELYDNLVTALYARGRISEAFGREVLSFDRSSPGEITEILAGYERMIGSMESYRSELARVVAGTDKEIRRKK